MKASDLAYHQSDAARRAGEWCLRLVEGELSPLEQAELDRWLKADPAHGDLLDDAATAWRAVERQASSPTLIALRGEALADIRSAYRGRRPGRVAWVAAWSSLAAAAVLVVALSLSRYAPAQTYATGIGERRIVVLTDGSTVSLDASTKVTVRFTDRRRDLWLLSGRANFRVAKNASRPFTVNAQGKLVSATGTEFSVELVRRQIRVILYEGRVAVFNHQAPGRYLNPGQELVVSQAPDDEGVIQANQSESLSWEGGQLIFNDEPLSTAVERINRYANEKLTIADEAAGAVRISGVFTAGDTAAFVAGITSVFPVNAREAGGGVALVYRTRSPAPRG